MIMTLILARNDFFEAMHIIYTCGWDLDVNSGNLRCLVTTIHSLEAFEGGPDWGPLADRVLLE